MRITVQGQPGHKAQEMSSQPVAGHGGMNQSSQLPGEAQIGGLQSRPARHKARPRLKNQREKGCQSDSSWRAPA
jgi:hypothetical protein